MTPGDDLQQRWRELAEQLGLPPESAAEAIAASAVVGKPEAGPVSTAVNQHRPEAVPEPPSRHADVQEVPRIMHDQKEADLKRHSSSTEEERRPSRGRGRGRRGSRSAEGRSRQGAESTRSDVEQGASMDLTGAEETSEPAPTQEPARRRERGRGRRAKATRDATDTPAVTDEQEDLRAKEDILVSAPEDDDADDMSGWSIPSWQDLIDSLYRPER